MLEVKLGEPPYVARRILLNRLTKIRFVSVKLLLLERRIKEKISINVGR